MMNWDILDRLKEVREKKQALKRQQRAAKDRHLAVEDLARRFHRVGKVELPFPTLFSQDQLTRYFGDLEQIDLSNPSHLAAVVWFLENAGNADIDRLTRDEKQAAIMARMAKISLEQLDETLECVTQIFLAIKKKSTQAQIQSLQEILRLLGNPAAAAAAN